MDLILGLLQVCENEDDDEIKGAELEASRQRIVTKIKSMARMRLVIKNLRYAVSLKNISWVTGYSLQSSCVFFNAIIQLFHPVLFHHLSIRPFLFSHLLL